MAIRFISDLAGTLQTYFRIAGIRLKNVADAAIRFRNKADTGDVGAGVAFLDLRKNDGTGTNRVRFAIGSEPGADVQFLFPVADGSTGYVLTTDGAGNLSWGAVSTASNQVLAQQEVIPYNSASPVTIFTPPANCTIRAILVEVETAFNATGAQLSVGVAGTPARYMGATDNDLATAALYESAPMYEEDGTPEAIIVTFTPGSGGSAGSARVTVEYSNPA